MRKLKPLIKRVFSILFLLLLILLFFYRYVSLPKTVSNVCHNPYEIEMHLIDVGQSEAILIIQRDYTMLIDAGEMFCGQMVADYIYDMGIDTIDVLVITHFHKDHSGGIHRVISSFNVEKIICMECRYISTWQERFWYTDMRICKALSEVFHDIDIDLESPYDDNGDLREISLGEARVTFLLQMTDTEIVNDKSIVIRVTFGEFSALFMADAEKEVEMRLLEGGECLSANVLKIGHHGSNTSSTMEFLNTVNPEYVLISCGLNNMYVHPHKQVMDRLSNLDNVQVYRTDLNGSIVVKSDESATIQVITEK